jgi:cytochrome c oxidase subunit 2
MARFARSARFDRLATERRMIALLALASIAAGCAPSVVRYPMDTLSPKSDLGDWVTSLFWQVTVWDSIVLAVVVVTFLLAIFVFSTREGDEEPPSTEHGGVALELAWTVIPAFILLAITWPTVKTIVRTQPEHWPANTLTVRVVARQWWWEFQYPTLGVNVADEFHIPINRPIHFELISEDVIHSFFMPALGGKRDVIPGQENQMTLIAYVPGNYYGQCAEFCGDSHANMRFRFVVDKSEDFDAWVKHQLEGPVKPTEGAAAAGAKVFANAPCAICHTIKGVSGFSKEYTYNFKGPDLTHFGSRTTLAGSMLDNTPANLAQWIRDPRAVKPGANMPTLGLRGDQLNDLVAYLESLK